MDKYSRETEQIRELAMQILSIAKSDRNKRAIDRWRNTNEMRKSDGPPIWCNPVGAWEEILPEKSLICTDPLLRGMEQEFKKLIIKHEIGDDTPVNDYYHLNVSYNTLPENIWGIQEGRHMPSQSTGAFAYNPTITDEADIEKLMIPQFTLNHEITKKNFNQLKEAIGDILPVRLNGHIPLHSIMGKYVADYRGLSEMMLDLAINPELVHKMMAHFRDGVLAAMEQVERMGILSENNDVPMYYSDSFGPEPNEGGLTYQNLWCATNSQEFDQVSPAMWEEFCLNYQKPILEKFGRVAYGCCENLTHKIDGVLSIPNLRIFVCSAWTDLDKVIDRVGDNYTIMWRQKATDVIFTDDIGTIKNHLEEGMRRLQGCHYQVVLRELQTLNNHPDRLYVWTQLAKEAATKFA